MSNPAVASSRRHRLEVRGTPEQDALVRQAADLEGTTVSAFVLETVTTRAKRVMKQHQDLVLSSDAFDRFLATLDKPVKRVPELVELFTKNPQLRETESAGGTPRTTRGAHEELDIWHLCCRRRRHR